MVISQLKVGVWSLALLLLALFGVEVAVYYDPLQFNTFVIQQIFKIGIYVRALFVITYALCFMLPDTTLKAELDRKKQKSIFNVDKGAFLIIAGCFVLGCILLFKAEIFQYSYYLELIGIALIIPSTPFVTHKLKPAESKYRLKTDTKKIENKYSFNFQGGDNTWVNIPNPFRGIGVLGSNGSGKTASIAEPIIAQAAYKNYSGVLFDSKFPLLTEVAYKHYSRSECKVELVIVNFFDLSRSHRINPLLPQLLHHQAYAYEFASAIYCSLERSAIEKKIFWDTSAISILAGVIWYMRNHYPDYCTIPHVLNIILNHDVYSLIGLLETDYETKTLISSVSTAIRTKAEGQLAGQYGTLQNALGRMNTKELAWVLSGDDFDINLNDLDKPKLLCVGSRNDLKEALSPVISLIITASLKQLNNAGKQHSMILLDEGPQCYIPHLSDVPATGRSNKVATIYMAQDIHQMITAYGENEAYSIIANLNTQLYGANPDPETGEHVSKLFGKEERLQRNESQNRSNPNSMDTKSGSSSQGVSFSIQDKTLIKPHEIRAMEPGEFIGVLVETAEPSFHTRLTLPKYIFPKNEVGSLPEFYDNVDADTNFERIRLECEAIIKGLIEPENEHLLIASSLRKV